LLPDFLSSFPKPIMFLLAFFGEPEKHFVLFQLEDAPDHAERFPVNPILQQPGASLK
jgi:hypothetical protein